MYLFSLGLTIAGLILQIMFYAALWIFQGCLALIVGMFGVGSKGFSTILKWMIALMWLPFKIFAMMFGLLCFKHNKF